MTDITCCPYCGKRLARPEGSRFMHCPTHGRMEIRVTRHEADANDRILIDTAGRSLRPFRGNE